jgi:fluoroacetyl-CoA thioesterase
MRAMAIGTQGVVTVQVNPANTALALGSGDLPVFGTPALVAALEQAAVRSLGEALEPGETTVGTWMQVAHLAASPVGVAVRAEAELTAVAGRILTFAVRAYDPREKIAEGEHRRAVVRRDRFLAKAQEKSGAL